jgi:hypothetical protein
MGVPIAIPDPERRLAALELELRQLRHQVALHDARSAATRPPEQTKFVKTWRSSSYPSGVGDPVGNTFDIRFCDAALDTAWNPGAHTLNYTPRSATKQAVATTFDRRFVLPDEICLAVLLNGHHFITAGPGLFYFGRLNSSLVKDGSSTIQLLRWNGTKLIDTDFDLTVRDCFLNATDDALAAKTKVLCHMLYPGRYYVTAAGCDVDSNADVIYQAELGWLEGSGSMSPLLANPASTQGPAQRIASTTQPPLV